MKITHRSTKILL